MGGCRPGAHACRTRAGFGEGECGVGRGTPLPFADVRAAYFSGCWVASGWPMESNSTSKRSTELGPICGPAPCSP